MNLPISIQKDTGIPIYVQLQEQIRLLLHRGVLKPGDPLPTTREIAVALSINSNTVIRVYRDLQSQKILSLQRGRGTFVAPNYAEGSILKKDFRKLEKLADQIISLSRESGFLVGELSQFIETRWHATKKQHHE